MDIAEKPRPTADLKAAFRKIIPKLTTSLRLQNVLYVASQLWSKKLLNDGEYDTIQSYNDDFKAVTQLLDYVYAREDACKIGFAIALENIGMVSLANELFPSSGRKAYTEQENATGVVRQNESHVGAASEGEILLSSRSIRGLDSTNESVAGDPKSRLRCLFPKLAGSLKLANVHNVAQRMFSAELLNDTENSSIKSCNESFKAVTLLVDYTYARGEACIRGLANALAEIGMKILAEELWPQAAANLAAVEQKTTGFPNQLGHHASVSSSDQSIPRPEAALKQTVKYQSPTYPHLPEAVQQQSVLDFTSGTRLFVAVQLRMSMRHTHLEVQVLLHADEQLLKLWQQAWKQREPCQPAMPQPKLVTLPGVSLDLKIVAQLTSNASASNVAVEYLHGCEETKPAPLPGYEGVKPRAWLFRLADIPQSKLPRFFTLHLQRVLPTLREEICEAFVIQDYSGCCFLYQLGLTVNNKPLQQSITNESLFARPATSGGIQALKTMRSIVEQAHSVGAIFVNGQGMRGTGICVGTLDHKYVLTCYHVYELIKQDHDSRKAMIAFEDSFSGHANAFALGHCIAGDKKLDYAILMLNNTDRTPQPISCCSIDFERLAQGEETAEPYLTVVGYHNNIRTVDVALDWQMPSKSEIDLVKEKAAECWRKYYDSFAETVQADIRHQIAEAVSQVVSQAVDDYDIMLDVSTIMLFYNIAFHKHGSSGSPVFLCQRDHSIKLVALHSRGFPDFYYNDRTKDEAQKLIPVEYTIEGGIRMSAICADLRRKNNLVCQQIFDRETLPMDEDTHA